jgi:hypothetical protein
MNNSTYMWHVTMAVHEDRVRALQRSRRDPVHALGNLVHQSPDLAQRLVCSRHTRPARVASRNQFSN